MPSTLERALASSLDAREKTFRLVDIEYSPPPAARTADFFSNDYLSLATSSTLRQTFLQALSEKEHVLGSSGSRPLYGTFSEHAAFERRMQEFFDVPAALLFNSGWDANVSFFSTVPQKGDAVIFDEFVHSSIHDGMASSRVRNALYRVSHNSIASFGKALERVAKEHPRIIEGKSTLFVVVESVYSMEGTFAPLPEILDLLERTVPLESLHVVVDEAHALGIFGESGKGVVQQLGLQKRVHSLLHSFGKSPGAVGGMVLTSSTVRKYLTNYARPLIYSTSLPVSVLVALNCYFDIVSGPEGSQLRDALQKNITHFHSLLTSRLSGLPPSIISYPNAQNTGLVSGIFPITIPGLQIYSLEHLLRSKGHLRVKAITYPAVPKGHERFRLLVHAANTEEEIKNLVEILYEWADQRKTSTTAEPTRSRL